MTVLITLTSAGANTGNFDLYSNLDGFVSAFETGISRANLVAGYTSYLVPNGTTTIRVKSHSACTNYVDIIVGAPTTTTTSTTSVPVNAYVAFYLTNDSGIINLHARVIGGETLDSLAFGGDATGYSDAGCSSPTNTYTFSDTLTAGVPPHSQTTEIGSYAWASGKITSLVVAGNTITTNPQNITVSGHVYNIQGFNSCTVL